MRMGLGIGISFFPAAVILSLLHFAGGPVQIGIAIFIGLTAALILEPWAAIKGGFQASFVGGLFIYGAQAFGGAVTGVGIWFILGLISG